MSATLLQILLSLSGSVSLAVPWGTSFTYDGSLVDGGVHANGSYDLRFTLFDAASSGSAVAGPLTNASEVVSNGLFTTVLDFGPTAFTGQARWLEIGVRTNDAGAFTTLSPRQPILATPYALHATTASSVAATNLTGTVGPNQLSGAYTNPVTFNNNANIFNGSGGGLLTLNASQLTFGTLPDARLSGTYGNAVTLGNVANQFTGTFNGNLNGNATSANFAQTAGSVTNFLGTLSGDVTGPQGATVVASVGGQSAANIANGLGAAGAATSANTPNTIVKRDASGSFSAGTITANGPIQLGSSASITADGSGIVYLKGTYTDVQRLLRVTVPPGVLGGINNDGDLLLGGVLHCDSNVTAIGVISANGGFSVGNGSSIFRGALGIDIDGSPVTTISNVLKIAKSPNSVVAGINNDGVLNNGGDIDCESNITALGTITASHFVGDGSGLVNVGGGGSAIPNMQVFNTNGTFTVPAGVTRIMVEIWGGGGGGSGGPPECTGGGGGGAGGYGKGVFNVAPGDMYSVQVGNGGSGGILDTNAPVTCFAQALPAGDGGPTSLGLLISATGGSGSLGNTNVYTMAAGGMSSASVNITGGAGYSSQSHFGGSGGAAGNGGDGGKVSDRGAAGDGLAPGGGGAGGNAGTSGGNGADGRVIVYY
jgi:hypothetical protein